MGWFVLVAGEKQFLQIGDLSKPINQLRFVGCGG
jgi:hypothetical protein